MTAYRRRSLTRGEEIAVGTVSFVVAAGVAAATAYLTRLLLARAPVGDHERETAGDGRAS